MNLKPYVTLEEYNQMKLYIEDLEDALRSCIIETGESLHLICSFGELGHSELSQAIKNSEQRKKKNA